MYVLNSEGKYKKCRVIYFRSDVGTTRKKEGQRKYKSSAICIQYFSFPTSVVRECENEGNVESCDS